MSVALNKQTINSISIELDISCQTIYKWILKYKSNIENNIRIENKIIPGSPQRNIMK